MIGAQIDYKHYAEYMRGALSGIQICNKDCTLNHTYFNTKKGYYWSQKHSELLVSGVMDFQLDIDRIKEVYFGNSKTYVELELRICILFNVKDMKQITEKDIKEFKNLHNQNNQKKSKK